MADRDALFRGHADITWKLIPSIGRGFSGSWASALQYEKASLKEFQRRALPHLQPAPKEDEVIEWLCLMQHHGCPTRLLDFTTNPLIALFFASDPSIDKDGEIVVAHNQTGYSDERIPDLFEHGEVFIYRPPHISDRIIGQASRFVCSPTPNEELSKNITKIPILRIAKNNIRSELRMLGISYSSIYPGLDGLCNELKDSLVTGLRAQGAVDRLRQI